MSKPATAQHTPGPWTVHDHAPYSVWAGETQVAACRVLVKDGENHEWRSAPYMEPADSYAQANARLIAAAPRMLALLTDLMDDDDTRQGPMGDEYRAILRDLEG